MAAPANQYRTIPFESKRANVITVNQRAIPTATLAVLLDRFYLDYLFITKDKEGNEGFIGLVLLGGANYLMHNPDRLGSVTFKMPMGVCVSFKDAGLNTLGKPIGNETVTDREFIGVRINQNYKSAWYVFSDACGMQMRMWNSNTNNWGGWTDTSRQTLAEALEQVKSFTVAFSDISESLRIHGFQVRPYLENAEGTYYGEPSLPIFVTGILTTLHLSSWGGTVKTYYRDTIELIAASQGQFEPTRFFIDEGMSIPYEPQGVDKFYYEDEKFITYGYSQLFDYYAILTKGEDTIPIPTEPPSPFPYRGFDANNQIPAEEQVLFNTGSNTGTIYLEELSGIAYKSYSGSYPNWVYGQPADRGYYANGNTAFITDVVYVGVEGDYTVLDPINQ